MIVSFIVELVTAMFIVGVVAPPIGRFIEKLLGINDDK